jgi:hypothetical protein
VSAREPEDPALAAKLESLRASGIRIDREGVFWHEGQPVLHQGMRQAFWRWLDRLPPPDQRHILRLDEQRFAYLEVEDTPLVATSLRWAGDEAWLGLNDGNEERLDPEGLTVDEFGVLRCPVRGGRLEARLATAAAATLAQRIVNTGSPPQPALLVAGQPRPLRPRAL